MRGCNPLAGTLLDVSLIQLPDGHIGQTVFNLIDARRVSDDTLVFIKRVETSSKELDIALMFNTKELRQDPRNYCVPILDHFADPDDLSIPYMAMPYLFPIADPPFQLVSEVMDFVDQTLVVRVWLLAACA